MKLHDLPNNKAVVFFDGYCSLCNGLVSLLIKLDKQQRLLFANFESEAFMEVQLLVPPETDSIVFYHNGKISVQSDAVINILQMLQRPWRLLSVVKYIPFKTRERIYSFVARHRHLIFKRKTECPLPSPRDADRFFI